MSANATTRRCGKCGAELSGPARDGLCAVCLLDSAFEGTQEAANHLSAPLLTLNDYEVFEEIARGGMGVVYRGQQVSLNRTVALKMMLGGHLANAADLKRFRAEAETAARLRHPHIVAVHEVGEHAGQPFFSMDLVEGRSLAQLVREEPLPSAKAANYLKTIAEAVHYAHSRGVLHRDLKPSNVLIDENDQPRVTDFGLAKRLPNSDLGTQHSELTLTGQVLGSPSFIPPEQAAGNVAAVGPASDVYSLGAILYYLLTGRPPFVAETLTQILRMVGEQEPVSPRLLNASVPRDLETVCLKCLEKEPPRRYVTAQELANELKRFLNNEPVVARPPSKLYRFKKSVQRNRPAFIASTAFFLLLVAGIVVSTSEAIRATRAEREQIQLRKLAEANERKALAEAARGSQAARGSLYLQQRNWQAAAKEYAQSIEVDTADPLADHLKSFQVAIALLESGKTNEYLQQCREMIARYKTTDDLYIAERVAKACLLLPINGSEFETACKLADFAAITRKESPWNCETKALAEYRSAHYSSATNWIVLSLSNTAIEPPCRAAVLFLEASAFAHLNDFPSARIALQQGEQVVEEYATTSGLHLGWWDWMIADILRREAKALLESQTNTPAGKNEPR